MIAMATAFMLALSVSWLLTPAVGRLAWKYGAVAQPRDRDVHTEPTPRWGGIAIYAGVVLAALVTVTFRHWRTDGDHGWTPQLAGVLLAGTVVAAAGLVDDLRELSAAKQIAAIVGAACILLYFGVRIEGVRNPFVGDVAGGFVPNSWIALSPLVGGTLTILWVLVVTKTVDAIDGLDGLAAGVCAMSAGSLALLALASRQHDGPTVALVAAAASGACVGFLRHNFNPARIFMSTVGSQFLGFTLAALAVMGAFKVAAALSVVLPVLVFGVPIFDYMHVLTRRFMHGAPLTQADQRHLHHRLLARGLTHRQAVYVIYFCTALLCIGAFAMLRYSH